MNQPSVEELFDSIKEGFERLQSNGANVSMAHSKLQLLDDMLWNTIVSLGLDSGSLLNQS